MGYEIVRASVTVTGRLSSHNDERDEQHRGLWVEVERELAEFAKALERDPRFAALELVAD